MATYNPNYLKLYFSKKKMTANKKIFYSVLNSDSRVLKKHLNKIIERKLVQEEQMWVNGEKIPVYTFPMAEKSETRYQLVNKEMLDYLVDTRNRQGIRIYIYLLNGYLWRKKEEDYFLFSNRDILKALGYSISSILASNSITNILESFKREGIINYENIYITQIDNDGKEFPSPRMKLTYIAQNKKELRKV